MSARRYPQIDIMKGLAILGVLFTHASAAPLPSKPLVAFYSEQAVPIFVVLMGLNLAMSMRRRANHPAHDHYARRLRRLAIPFAIVFAASSVIATWRWFAAGVRPNIGPSLLLGYLPFGGAGNYFVFIIAAFTIASPALWAAYRRWPLTSVLTMLGADTAFELTYGALAADIPHFSVYGGNPMRLLAAFAIGLWLADGWGIAEPRNRWLLALAPVSLAYMIAVQLGHPLPLFPGAWQPQNVLAFGYTAVLVMLGMRWLPSARSGLWRLLASLGQASYHIFLAQLLYFGFHERLAVVPIAEDLTFPSAIGWLFCRADQRLGLSSGPAVAGAPAFEATSS